MLIHLPTVLVVLCCVGVASACSARFRDSVAARLRVDVDGRGKYKNLSDAV
mgnify:CR=1 FL=1|jgi:hypothetical protein